MVDASIRLGVGAVGFPLGTCAYCPNAAATACTGCGRGICGSHAAPDAPSMCIQCAGERGLSGPRSSVPKPEAADQPPIE
jgi:hypothetical protein